MFEKFRKFSGVRGTQPPRLPKRPTPKSVPPPRTKILPTPMGGTVLNDSLILIKALITPSQTTMEHLRYHINHCADIQLVMRILAKAIMCYITFENAFSQ